MKNSGFLNNDYDYVEENNIILKDSYLNHIEAIETYISVLTFYFKDLSNNKNMANEYISEIKERKLKILFNQQEKNEQKLSRKKI